MATVTTTLRLSRKLRAWMKAAADSQNRTVTNYIITVVTRDLRENHADKEPTDIEE